MTERVERERRTDGAAVARSMSVTAGGHLVGQVAWFGSLIVLGALLDPDAFGVVAAGLVIVNAGTLLMGAGTGGSIVTTKRLAGGQIRASIRLNVALGGAMTLGLLVLAGPIVDQFAKGGDPTVLRWLSLAIMMHAISIVPTAVLRKQMRFGRDAVATLGAYTVAGVVAVALGVFGAGVWSLVARIVMYEAALAAMTVWFARSLLRGGGRLLEAEDGAGAKRSGGRWFFLLALADFVAFNADYMIVGRYTDAEQLGLYSLAFLLAFAPLRQFSWKIGSVLFAASAATDEPAEVRAKMSRALRLGSPLLIPVAIPSILMAPILIPGVLGDKWEPMVTTFQVLVVTGIAHAVMNIGAEFLAGAGHIDLRARLSVVWATGMVIALLVVVPSHGIIGAAWVHAGLFVPLMLATSVLGARRLGFSLGGLLAPMASTARAFVAQAAATAFVWLALNAVGVSSGWVAVTSAAVSLGVAIGSLSTGTDRPLREIAGLLRNSVRARSAT